MEEGETQPQKGTTLAQTIVAGAILTLLAGAAGGALGYLQAGSDSPPPVAAAPAGPAGEAEGEDAEPTPEIAEPNLRLVPLQPVLTNLAGGEDTWLRIEANLVLRQAGEDEEPAPDDGLLAAQVEADTLAFLRQVELSQIDGTRGLLHLSEDLRERARERSPAVVDYLLRTLVVE